MAGVSPTAEITSISMLASASANLATAKFSESASLSVVTGKPGMEKSASVKLGLFATALVNASSAPLTPKNSKAGVSVLVFSDSIKASGPVLPCALNTKCGMGTNVSVKTSMPERPISANLAPSTARPSMKNVSARPGTSGI